MKVLPNGVKIFNATPHPVNFWREDWPDVVVVESDAVINAVPQEKPVDCLQPEMAPDYENVWRVRTVFVGDGEGHSIIKVAKSLGADIIVGSMIAAQAYPGEVCAMIPAPGFERVPPAEKRMRPDKFTIY